MCNQLKCHAMRCKVTLANCWQLHMPGTSQHLASYSCFSQHQLKCGCLLRHSCGCTQQVYTLSLNCTTCQGIDRNVLAARNAIGINRCQPLKYERCLCLHSKERYTNLTSPRSHTFLTILVRF